MYYYYREAKYGQAYSDPLFLAFINSPATTCGKNAIYLTEKIPGKITYKQPGVRGDFTGRKKL